MKAFVLGAKGALASPPPLPIPAGSASPIVPDVRPMLVLPATALMSERPSQPETSLERFSAPTNDSLMLAR